MGQGHHGTEDAGGLWMPWDWQHHGQGMQDAVGRHCCGVHSCVPGLISCGCVLARAGNGFEACWYVLRVLTAPQGQFH